MSYQTIDPIINKWAEKHTIRVLVENSENCRRLFYISSATAETFQVVIEPEQDGFVRVDAHLIETWSGEVHCWWEVPTAELEFVLDRALNFIKDWLCRSQLR